MPLKAASRLFGLDECGDLIRIRLIDGLPASKTIRKSKEREAVTGREGVKNDCDVYEWQNMESSIC